MSRLGVFKNNEHVIVTTIMDLTKVFFGKGGLSGEAAVKSALEEYVKVASFVLLRLKMRHHYAGGEGHGSSPVFKFFCMYAFLDKFVEQCPQVRATVMMRDGTDGGVADYDEISHDGVSGVNDDKMKKIWEDFEKSNIRTFVRNDLFLLYHV